MPVIRLFSLLIFSSISLVKINNKIIADIVNIPTFTFPYASNIHLTDTVPTTLINSITALDKKVIVSSGDQTFELSPSSSFNNGAVFQPIDNQNNKGISTSFFLKDSSYWSFYTDSKRRLTINGNGNIETTAPLLINNALPDGMSALRVNGVSRFDSSIFLQGILDSNSFISLHRNIEMVGSVDDRISPYTTTPSAWSVGTNVPGLRIRHPNNVSGKIWDNNSIERDFMIVPYNYGMAIEYNGVVECWVGEWSIHKGVYYNDTEGKGNGWGAVLWVGDDVDKGGIRATARNNTSLGGNVAYGELSVEKFGGTPNGDFHFRLPSTENQFNFIYGERGSENTIAKLSNQGLILPKVPSTSTVLIPEKAQILFDNTENKFKGFDGNDWVGLSEKSILTGSYSASGDSNKTTFIIPHGITNLPSYFNAVPISAEAANIKFITADNSNIYIHYTLAPNIGNNNLSWNWILKN